MIVIEYNVVVTLGTFLTDINEMNHEVLGFRDNNKLSSIKLSDLQVRPKSKQISWIMMQWRPPIQVDVHLVLIQLKSHGLETNLEYTSNSTHPSLVITWNNMGSRKRVFPLGKETSLVSVLDSLTERGPTGAPERWSIGVLRFPE